MHVLCKRICSQKAWLTSCWRRVTMASRLLTFTLTVLVCVMLTWPLLLVSADFLPFKPTPHLKRNVLARCQEYLAKYSKLRFINPPQMGQEDKYCDDIWDNLVEAFAGKDSCQVTDKDYHPFFTATGPETLKINDKVLFWSKHQKLSLELSHNGQRAAVLADTLTGYLMTDFVWCGEKPGEYKPPNPDGINYHKCPECKKQGKKKEHFEVFWGVASEMFAKRATGVVRHLVNGQIGTKKPNCAHHEGTFFAKYELPNLDKTKVTEFRIIVANEPGKPVLERCGTGTVKKLQDLVKGTLGKEPVCVENPKLVMHIFCSMSEHIKKPECQSFDNYPDF